MHEFMRAQELKFERQIIVSRLSDGEGRIEITSLIDCETVVDLSIADAEWLRDRLLELFPIRKEQSNATT